RQRWDDKGVLIIVNDLSEAPALANRLAAEHVELAVDEPEALLAELRHARSEFRRRDTPGAVGDYDAGPSPLRPTRRPPRAPSRPPGSLPAPDGRYPARAPARRVPPAPPRPGNRRRAVRERRSRVLRRRRQRRGRARGGDRRAACRAPDQRLAARPPRQDPAA